MFKWIRCQLDKLDDSPGLLRHGQWRVHYPDCDGWSKKLTYDVATDYAAMFKGTVHWVRYDDPAHYTSSNKGDAP